MSQDHHHERRPRRQPAKGQRPQRAISIRSVRRSQPDLRKLAQVLIALAEAQAEADAEAQARGSVPPKEAA